MKKLNIIIAILTGISLVSCTKQTYYDANNRNIQRFDTELEEKTAKYILELNDDIMLVKFIATHARQQTQDNEFFADAEELEKTMKRMKMELQMEALLQNITVSSELSERNDDRYGHFQETEKDQIEKVFKNITEKTLQNILKKTEVYITEGNNEKIQKFSLEVKNEVIELLDMYS
ncbi:MAG: hypothetical protein ABJN36_16985 [Cyclobacteriaceae bacterium]